MQQPWMMEMIEKKRGWRRNWNLMEATWMRRSEDEKQIAALPWT